MEDFDLVPLGIYVLFPLVGLTIFLWLRQKVRKDDINKKLIWPMFALFFTYGGLLTVALTVLFWQWSGLASLGIFYLIFVAPVLVLILVFKQFKLRMLSNYHKYVFYFSAAYFIVAPIILIMLFHFSKN